MAGAESNLRTFIDKILRELKYTSPEITIQALTSGGANFTSTLYNATVKAPSNVTLKLFAKAAITSEKIREVMKVERIFQIEDFFYTDLAKIYNNLQEKHNIPMDERFIFPKFYGSNLEEKQEILVMENLLENGYQMLSRFKVVDWQHMAVATQTLARFHALSFAYRKEDPNSFDIALDKVKVDTTMSDDPNVKDVVGKMIGAAVQVVKDEYKERLMKFLNAETARDEYIKFRMPLSTPVLCHGDYRISNLLFRRQNGKPEPIAVDYQMLHPGSPVVDLLYLEFTGTDEEFRRENHERLLDYYFQELSLALTRLDVDVNEVYPREIFDAEFKQMLPLALRFATFVLPLVTLETERAPTLDGQAEIQDLARSPSQLFAERFSGIVNDCVRWGAL